MEENTVKFATEKGYFICENEVFKLPLSPIDKLTYIALTRYAGSTHRAWPSYNRLAEDVGIGKKRAIEAVKTLLSCHLIEKSPRNNSSNIYLVYPPKYYCNEKDDDLTIGKDEKGGVRRTPLKGKGVSVGHHPGGQRTPEGCPEDTEGVSTGHPITNSISNSINNNSTIGKKEEVNPLQQKEIKTEDIETIKRNFGEKGYEVNDSVIEDMLNKYSFEEAKAAINCTNFDIAKNPIAVIYSLLQTGRYVKPKKKRGPDNPEISDKPPDVDPVIVDKYFQDIRHMLKKSEKELVIATQ